ncbi:MAG TPA: YicC family protein [Lentisphaeria bacterium]|nr:MAG: YicC family protein [Lentisphaerae bacterium GWF2_49_21]HBC88317.1 YicC family protein [Lentisphaeria bacterium]
MKSMTGYGFGEQRCSSGVTFTVEMSSVNKKNLDFRISLPKDALQLEPVIRQISSKRISRGFITVRVDISTDESFLKQSVKINDSLAKVYYNKIKSLQEKNDIPGAVEISDIINLPGVVDDSFEGSEFMKNEDCLATALNSAIDKLTEMRSKEGESLCKDLEKRISILESVAGKIQPLAEKIPQLQKEQLLKRLEDNGLQLNSNDERVHREIVIFADRSDVTEELTRLKSHFKQFREFIRKPEPCGRSLDFLTQEIQREISTIGNKALHGEVSPLVVEFKTELEKIREQVQNIE